MRSKNWFGFVKRKIDPYKTYIKWQIKDLLRRKGMPYLSFGRFLEYIFLRSVGYQSSLRYLMDAHRYYQSTYLTKLVCSKKQLIEGKIDSFVDRVYPDQIESIANRTIVLKKPNIQTDKIEKGVLLITFTGTMSYFHDHVACEKLLKYFYVVLEPSWAGYCDPNILFWMKYKPHPIIIEATEEKDYHFINSLNSNLLPVPFGASDWTDFRIFQPKIGVKKKYDAVYVANYNPIKRHHVLFKTVRDIGDPDYHFALILGKWGEAKLEIEHLIDYYGISKNISLYEELPQIQVNDILNMSKVNVLLSLKEGSNRSIFEGLFANVPGIVLKNNIGVRKDYINEMTGLLIDEKDLKNSLLYFRSNWVKYNPRLWALNHISPLVTTRKLSQFLEKIARDRGEPWTSEIVPKVNAPEVKHFNSHDEQSMPGSKSVISLFLKNNFKTVENDDELCNSLRKLCDLPSDQLKNKKA